ncbi:unnamed protein product [Microthlaspi erraticum]|uniref:TAZ-type domain-containing protein n=1 Tax=Microthlaspi erraticum TaxID=1685480 RepID=A0A6D2I3N8_9BRAS|nr:unnamed protein product [Microthlaspi erraticum]
MKRVLSSQRRTEDTIPLNPNHTLRVKSNQASDMEHKGKHLYPGQLQKQDHVIEKDAYNMTSKEVVVKEDCCGQDCIYQKRWLRFVLHALRCNAAEDECEDSKDCFALKKIIKHQQSCKRPLCTDLYCLQIRRLIRRYELYKDQN